MNRPRIIIDDKIPFIREALSRVADVSYLPGSEITNRHLRAVDALIIRTRTTCNEALLANTKVRFIATTTIGYDHLDLVYLAQANIKWCAAPGCNAGSVLQYVAAALAYISEDHQLQLKDYTLGVIGCGNVGGRVAALGEILGMKVLRNDPPRARNEGGKDFIALDQLLKEADIISLHVPLSKQGLDKTFHMFSRSLEHLIKRQPYLINTSRGEVIDRFALKDWLKHRRLAGAILDVWENEPHIDRQLLDGCILGTPHIAGYSADGKANAATAAVRAVSQFFDLGLNDWQPKGLESPLRPLLEVGPLSAPLPSRLNKLILATYDIRRDNDALKKDPQSFEALRGNYPNRREFPAYSIKPDNMTPALRQTALDLGFVLL